MYIAGNIVFLGDLKKQQSLPDDVSLNDIQRECFTLGRIANSI